MKKKKDEITIRSSAAEYLTYVASVGDQQDSIEMRYEDENIWLTQKMNIGTAANAVFHMRQVEEKELKREKIASWYITVPGIPAQEKEKLEKSLKYNVWSSLIRFVVLYFIFSCIWIFGVGRYDPFESVTGYRLIFFS